MELNDNEFDAAFRKKVFDADLQFEDAAWDKMEQKLRRRDRVVFFRRAGAVCLLLLLVFGGGYLLLNQTPVKEVQSLAKRDSFKTDMPVQQPVEVPAKADSLDVNTGVPALNKNSALHFGLISPDGFKHSTVNGPTDSAKAIQSVLVEQKNTVQPQNNLPNIAVPTDSLTGRGASPLSGTGSNQVLAQSVKTPDVQPDSAHVALPGTDVLRTSVAAVIKKQKSKRANSLPVSLSLSVGPEFNSSGAVIGGKKGFSAGLGVSVGIAKRFSLQSGINYSAKDYAAEAYEYKFRNEKIKPLISEVDASCAVLEIPIQLSYHLLNDANRSVDINAGMSSYFMLKENYNFRYTAESGIKDRQQQFNNKNQHYFGVVDLSATYYVKLKKEGLKLGLEPYVKIPVTGVGEGKVNLKSSGVSLKLRYDLGKKNR